MTLLQAIEKAKFHQPFSYLGPFLPLKRNEAFTGDVLLKVKMGRLSIAGDEEDDNEDVEMEMVQKEKTD